MPELQYLFLDREPEVAEFFGRLAGAPALAVDLEADSLHRYRESVCLVQVSTPDVNAVIDPLAVPAALDLLAPVLADPAVRKIFHGGDYDVRLLKKERGVEVRNLFDTMIAAQLTGRERFGLAALLEELYAVRLDKRHQRADWSRRPLGPEMLAYAAADTAHLFGLAERLAAELTALGRLAWAAEEFRLLEQIVPGPQKTPSCLDVKGASRLAPRELARLQALLELRDELARAANRPPFKILMNETLIAWALAPPANRAAVTGTPGAGGPLVERNAERVLEALARAEGLALEECPRRPVVPRTVLSPAQERLLARLKAVREEAARRLGLAPGLLVNGATLERLCRADDGAADVAGALKDWQREVLGDALAAALAGR
jgi:ribonuclease D